MVLDVGGMWVVVDLLDVLLQGQIVLVVVQIDCCVVGLDCDYCLFVLLCDGVVQWLLQGKVCLWWQLVQFCQFQYCQSKVVWIGIGGVGQIGDVVGDQVGIDLFCRKVWMLGQCGQEVDIGDGFCYFGVIQCNVQCLQCCVVGCGMGDDFGDYWIILWVDCIVCVYFGFDLC